MSTDTVLSPICLSPPQPGDFLCVPTPGLGGTVIEVGEYLAERLQHQPAALLAYDHAELYVGQADKANPDGYTCSAYPSNDFGGLTGRRPLPCPPAQVPGAIWSSGIIELTQEQRNGIVAWCELHPDVSYSWPDYGAIALHALHVPAPGLKTYIGGSGSYICSQYVDSALRFGGGVHLFADGRWPGYVTPADLAALLLAEAHLAVPGPA